MRNLFAVSWLTAGRRTLLSIAAALVVVLGIFALLKIGSGGKQVPALRLNRSLPRGRCKALRWIAEQFHCRVRGQIGYSMLQRPE